MKQEKPTNGVVVPQETINASKEYKKKHRTLRQLPLYRDMANFKYLVAKLLRQRTHAEHTFT